MVKFGGRLAQAKWALTAIWLGDGRLGRCRARIRRARGRTLHDLFLGENVYEGTSLRPRGSKDQG
jgi:hypothetical protein